MSDSNDFQPVTFEKERERVFQDLVLKPVLVTAWTPGLRPLFFHVHGVDSAGLHLTVVDGDGAEGSQGDIVELLFSMDDGQYHLRTELKAALHDRWTVGMDGELSRLQRRSNFRTMVPRGFQALLKVTGIKTRQIQKTDMALIDISAGGARVRWPKSGLVLPHEGDALSAEVRTPGREIEVFGIVKNIRLDADTGDMDVGLEFHNISGRDEQALLQLCLQIRRHTSYGTR